MLGSFKDPRAVMPLTRALRDADRAVREAAIRALSSIGAPSVPALGHLSGGSCAACARGSLGHFGVACGCLGYLTPLVDALSSRDWIVRMHAAKALGRIGDPEAVSVLMPLLQDKVKAVREEASGALAAIGGVAVLALIQALQHDEWLVRLHAVEALGKLKSSSCRGAAAPGVV